MKAIIRTLFVIVVIISLSFTLSAQEKKSKKELKQEKFDQTMELINKGNFKFEARRAYPQGGRSIDLTTNYGFITVKQEAAEGDLPFFGRAYTASYGGDGGIKFDGEMLDKNIEVNQKKQKVILTFEVRDKDTYKVTMDIGYNGNASVGITSNNRSHINYQGEIKKIEKEE
ncbi:MAG: DUF4251 domain-containing protein [Marinilabiliaceae bacterium]|nr:DUF4251 domain-containing protein [Marinilabiliaceae bacterium]